VLGPLMSSTGHAGLRVEAPDLRLLCDPWVSAGGAFLGSWFPFPDNSHLRAVRGLARRMCADSGVSAPSGSSSKWGTSTSRSPSSGAPDSLRRPMISSCVFSAVRSQNSTRLRITRTTWYEPPTAHAGSASPGCTHTSSSISGSSVGAGLAVPSLNPSRLRVDTCPPVSVFGRTNPLAIHRSVRLARVTRISRRSAWVTVSSVPPQICSSRSPWL